MSIAMKCLLLFSICSCLGYLSHSHAQPTLHNENEIPPLPIVTLFPDGLASPSLKANLQEPRIGVFKFIDDSGMKVDIGNSIDIIRVIPRNSKMSINAGVDFFAFAFVKSNQGLRLQIDALDGFFGGNISFWRYYSENSLQARVRILHHSAHIVDGHYENESINISKPIPFTRDFGELMLVHNWGLRQSALRYYGGISYATLVRPAQIKKFSGVMGGEYSTAGILPEVYGQPTNIFVAYNISFFGTPAYTASQQIQCGVKIGEWHKKGVTAYIAYYAGKHMFAEYYYQRLETIGMGFTVDYF